MKDKARKLKVWGGATFAGGTQRRTLVCAASKKRAVELLSSVGLSTTLNAFITWWSETGNSVELSIATEEGVWRNEVEDISTAKRPESYKRIK